MGFRTVVVNARSRCELRLGYLVVRKNLTDEQRIFLDEINVIIFATTAASCTVALLAECAVRNIKVIFSDPKGNPCAEVLSYDANSDVVRRSREPFGWSDEIKGNVWREIVRCKIQNQALVMNRIGYGEIASQLMSFANDVAFDDSTNREGHAAKVYFNKFLPDGVQRHQGGALNSMLDYGYTIALSVFNQAVTANGYLTEIGIHHRSENNPFNFSCDLMEPFRFVIDLLAKSFDDKCGVEFKRHMHRIFEMKIRLIDDKTYEFFSAVNEYARSVIRALNSADMSVIKFPMEALGG